MSITITDPAPLTRYDTGTPVTFSGNATDGAAIELYADDPSNPDEPYDLGSATIDENGDWTLTHAFSQPGLRTVTASAYDDEGNSIASASVRIQLLTEAISCTLRSAFLSVGMHTLWRLPGDKPFFFSTGMAIDADGSPHAYNPQDTGLDALANAKDGKGNFVGVAVDENGDPIVQSEVNPAPGYYVSTTSLEDDNYDANSPYRYVDSEVTPYIVLPPQVLTATGGSLGDFVVVYNGANGAWCCAIVGDRGPRSLLGEASIATAKALGVSSNARIGGASSGILYIVFPGSRVAFGTPWAHNESRETIDAQTTPLFEDWGGMDRVKAYFFVI